MGIHITEKKLMNSYSLRII